MALPTLPRPRTIVVIALLTFALVFLAFGRALWQGFQSDDFFLIVQNLAVRGVTPESLRLAFTTFDPELYIPLTLVSFQIDSLLAELQPWMFHLTNLLLHTGNALLVMWLLLLLTKQRSAAFFAGLLFAVHPLHTEAAVWVAGRKDLLSAFFILLSLITYIRYRDGKRGAYAISILLFVLALLSKIIAITLPAVIVLLDLLWERRKFSLQWFLDKIPYVLLSGVFSLVGSGGKERILSMISIPEMALVAGKSIAFYLWKFIAPHDLSIIYPQTETVSLLQPEFFLPLLLVLALVACALFLWKHAPLAEDPERNRGLAFGMLFFLITLSPTLLHSRKGDGMIFAVDRYAYLPSIGLLLIVALLLPILLDRFRSLPRESVRIAAGVLVAILMLLSFRQVKTWDSPEMLYRNVLRLYPASVDARVALAGIWREEGKTQEAFDLLKEGLQYGDHVQLRLGAAYIYAATGDVPSAREQLQKASELRPQNPDPIYMLAQLDEKEGGTGAAADRYREAVILDPSFVGARVSLAKILIARGTFPEAEEQLRAALQWNPSDIGTHLAYATLLEKMEKKNEALDHVRTALRVDAGNGEAKALLTRLTQ